MYEETSGGSRLGPTFIGVLVVLAAVAGTIAYVVARQVSDGQTVTSGTPGPDASDPTATSDPAAESLPPDAKDCPQLTEQAAIDSGSPGDLKQVLFIRTSNSEVWICQDSGGRLWYQGHSPHTAPFTAATSDVSLFLTEVRQEGDSYVAVNRGASSITTYRISRTELSVDNPAITEPVIDVEG